MSHRSATVLQGLGDIPSPRYEFTVETRRRSTDPEVTFHKGQLTNQDVTVIEGLPVTKVLRTVTDLAAEGVDGGHLGGVCSDVLTRGLSTRAELSEALDRHSRKYGIQQQSDGALLEYLLEQNGSRLSEANAFAVVQSILAKTVQPELERIARLLTPRLTRSVIAQIADLDPTQQNDDMRRQAIQSVAENPKLLELATSVELEDVISALQQARDDADE